MTRIKILKFINNKIIYAFFKNIYFIFNIFVRNIILKYCLKFVLCCKMVVLCARYAICFHINVTTKQLFIINTIAHYFISWNTA